MKLASNARFAGIFAAFIAPALLGSSPARAEPITYKIEATASGSLGGVPFIDALVTVWATANTDEVMGSFSSNQYVVYQPEFFGSIAGIGDFRFFDDGVVDARTVPMGTGDGGGVSDAGSVSFVAGRKAIFNVMGYTLAEYDLKTAIVAPGDIGVVTNGNGVTYATSLGTLTISRVDTSSGIFTATTVAVPEPAAIAMLGVGTVVVGSVAARNRSRR